MTPVLTPIFKQRNPGHRRAHLLEEEPWEINVDQVCTVLCSVRKSMSELRHACEASRPINAAKNGQGNLE